MADQRRKNKLPLITWSFEEGRFWDLWMVVHVLAGIGLGLFFEVMQLGFLPAFLTTLFLAVVWEVAESKIFHIRESVENQIIDTIIALAGFAVAYALSVPFDPLFTIPALIAVVIVIVLLDYEGYKAYKRRNKISK